MGPNDGLEGPAPAEALAAPALTPPVEPKPAARPHGARHVSTLLALGTAALTTGVVATLAVFWWVGPPAIVVRVSPEPLRAAPAGVVAPAPSAPAAPPHEASAEPAPPETPSAEPTRRPAASTSKAEDSERARLEARLWAGRGDLGDALSLAKLCREAGDGACLRRALAFVGDLGADR